MSNIYEEMDDFHRIHPIREMEKTPIYHLMDKAALRKAQDLWAASGPTLRRLPRILLHRVFGSHAMACMGHSDRIIDIVEYANRHYAPAPLAHFFQNTPNIQPIDTQDGGLVTCFPGNVCPPIEEVATLIEIPNDMILSGKGYENALVAAYRSVLNRTMYVEAATHYLAKNLYYTMSSECRYQKNVRQHCLLLLYGHSS